MAVSWLGLTFGDDGTGWVRPTYSALRGAAGTYWRKLRNMPGLNTAPGSFFGDMLDMAVSVVDGAVQVGGDAVSKALFTQASGVSLDLLLSPVTVRFPATSSTAAVYAYGAVASIAPLGSLVRTSPTATGFALDTGITVPALAAAEAWVWEVEDFDAGEQTGVTFTLTVNGSPVAVVAGAGDDSEDIRDALVAGVNALALTQAAYAGGTLPTVEPTRWAGLVREESGGGPFPVLFVSTGAPALTSLYTAASDSATAIATGPVSAAAESLRYGQPFAGIVGYLNVTAAVVGRDQETDAQMRARHQLTQRLGGGNPDAIRSGVLTPVERGGAGATYCSVEYNSTPVTDAVGNVANSIRVIVDSVVDKQIVANVVFALKAAGDNTNGPFPYLVVDSEGKSQDINIDELVDVFIWCDIEVTPGEGWPANGDPLAQLRADVVAFITALEGGDDVKPNDAPVSSLPDGSSRGVSDFRLRFGYSTDPLGILPPITYLDYWPDPQPDASLATVTITGRQVAETSLARVAAIIA